jgi:hypothetical protein
VQVNRQFVADSDVPKFHWQALTGHDHGSTLREVAPIFRKLLKVSKNGAVRASRTVSTRQSRQGGKEGPEL